MKKIMSLLVVLCFFYNSANSQTFPVVNLTASGYIQNAIGSAAAPTYNFTGHTTTGLYWANPGIGFSVAGSSAGSILSTGWNGAVVATTISASTPIPITSGGTGNTTGTSTVNANLTGVITSVGNATSTGAQTGTGNTFVMQTSPTLTTPNLGTPSTLIATNATGTASALNIGGNAATATTATNQSGGTVSATTLTASNAVTLSPSSGNVTISPTSGSVTINPSSAGTINGMSIGQSTAAAVTGTTLTASTGGITPHYPNGIVGVTGGTSISAGSIGEIVTNSASGVSLTSTTTTNITNTGSLASGLWMVVASVYFNPAGGATPTSLIAAVNTVSATIPSAPLYTGIQSAFTANAAQSLPAAVQIFNTSGATTFYCIAQAIFAAGTATANCTIVAIRL